MFGEGVTDDVREGYEYLVGEYNKGDEIFLFGFSRGAFIVRSLAGLISQQGLKKMAKADFNKDFPRLQKQIDPLLACSKQNAPDSGGNDVQIKAVCVWDTVGECLVPFFSHLTVVTSLSPYRSPHHTLTFKTSGALGIPRLDIGNYVIQFDTDDYRMHDTALSSVVQNAFQALALDEHRAAFTPTLWERPSSLQNIKRKLPSPSSIFSKRLE